MVSHRASNHAASNFEISLESTARHVHFVSGMLCMNFKRCQLLQ